jgi:hypothetical protein
MNSPQNLIWKSLAEAFADLNKLLKMFKNMDLNTKRFPLIQRNVHCILYTYKQIYNGKKESKQTTMYIFLKSMVPFQEECRESPSQTLLLLEVKFHVPYYPQRLHSGMRYTGGRQGYL